MDTPCLAYPFTHWWTSELFLLWGYYESSCCEYMGTSFCVDACFHFSWVIQFIKEEKGADQKCFKWIWGWVIGRAGRQTSLVAQCLRLCLLMQGGTYWTPGQGAKIPHASWPKKQNTKQEKFNKDFKNGPHQKKFFLSSSRKNHKG